MVRKTTKTIKATVKEEPKQTARRITKTINMMNDNNDQHED